jgi:NhaC family Na+:H+ antiporter
MLWTTTPAWLLALLVYFVLGRGHGGAVDWENVETLSAALDTHFRFNVLLLIPPAITLGAAILRKPVIPGLVISIAVALLLALTVQSLDNSVIGSPADETEAGLYMPVRIAKTLVNGPSPDTGNADLDNIVGRGGLVPIMATVLLTICAFCFAGIAQKAGMLDVLLKALSGVTRTTGQLVAVTISACVLVACMTGESYLAILIPGELFSKAFKKMKLAAKNLSRITEDSGTVVVPLIPWSVTGIFIFNILDVPVYEYAPWAIFNYSGIVFSLLYGFTGFKMAPRIREDETQVGS